MTREFHELANLFPMLDEADTHELATDIKTRGLLDPITLFEGKILDGRNRYRACGIAGIKPRFKEFDGPSALCFVLSKNLHRRHLSESQRAMVAGKIANMRKGRPPETWPCHHCGGEHPTDGPNPCHGDNAPIGAFNSQDDAADKLNVGRRSVQRAREVLDNGVDELQEAVESGEVSVSAAAEVAGLSEDEQRAAVASGAAEVRRVAAEIRQKRSSAASKIYETATKALSKWREKYLVLGEDDLRMIVSEVFTTL